MQAYIHAARDQGAHHFPSILSPKRQRSNLISANQVIYGPSAFGDAAKIAGCIYRSVGGFVARWSLVRIGAIPMLVTGTYNPYLVALSALVASFASYTARADAVLGWCVIGVLEPAPSRSHFASRLRVDCNSCWRFGVSRFESLERI